jgi:uncharacterized Rmd1/YagE family protein
MKIFNLTLIAVFTFFSPHVISTNAIAQAMLRDRSGAFDILFTKDKDADIIVYRNGAYVLVNLNRSQKILIVNGLTERDLQVMRMDLDTFKKELKQQTGYRTVFLK